MASQIPGFEYDIFISYRQKDNKGERWVTEFVEALKTELDSTFKEEVSVYFDVNPHDGLLEIHDVDDSLKKKLKCIVFIPVISQTYCDTNSFAWEHEFKAFVEQSSSDKFGLKVSLPNGNVINRVLPVRIHELDFTDIKLCESVLGSVLRGIEFVYKAPGVNRPLRGSEEHPQDNINKTYYRDQINKVANGLKEIISALKNQNDPIKVVSSRITNKRPVKLKSPKTTLIAVSLMALVIIALFYFLTPRHSVAFEPFEKTIAVLPFEKWFSDKDYSYLGDAIASQINTQLRAVKTFYVISFNSTRKYIGSDIPSIKQIGRECGANVLIQGSVELSKNKNDVTINVQLTNTTNNSPIWDDKFKGELDSLQTIRSRIILKIAQALKVELTTDEVRLIETGLTKSSDAYKHFLSANYQDEAASLAMMGKKYHDSISFERAIKLYDKAIEYDTTFALAYARRAISRSWAIFIGDIPAKGNIEKCKKDIDKALKLDPKLPEGMNAYGFYYYYCLSEYQKALGCFKQASDLDPGNWQPVFYMAIVYRRMGDWTKSKSLLNKVLKYNPQDALILTNIGATYSFLRDYDSALIYHDMAIRAMPNWTAPYINKIQTLLLKDGTTMESRICIDTATKRTGNRFQSLRILFDIYDSKFKEALIKTELSDRSDFTDQSDKLLEFATIHNYLDHPDLAKIYYDSSLVFLAKKLKYDKEDPTNLIRIGYAYAGLKKTAKAFESGEKAVKLSTDVLKKYEIEIELAEIYINCGYYSKGIRQIDELLNTPSNLSVRFLSLDPVWKPILQNPDFQKIIEKHMKE